MDGQDSDPDGLQLFQRFARRNTCKLLRDKTFDIFSIKEELGRHLEKFCNKNDSPDLTLDFEITIPTKVLKVCEEEGLHWIAGFMAVAYTNVNVSKYFCWVVEFMFLVSESVGFCMKIRKDIVKREVMRDL